MFQKVGIPCIGDQNLSNFAILKKLKKNLTCIHQEHESFGGCLFGYPGVDISVSSVMLPPHGGISKIINDSRIICVNDIEIYYYSYGYLKYQI